MKKRNARRSDKSSHSVKKSSPSLKRVHVNAAGIDVGSERHFVAVPADRDSSPVQSFGCTTPELHDMSRWLKACGVKTVAMESTGVYWVPVAQVLETYGLEVLLVDARHVKHVPGRKTDVQDCQWLQKLHSFGLLRGAFRPEDAIQILRGYWRHRSSLVEQCSQQIQRMQKALEQMNIQLHKVLSDITGVTGMLIIRSILNGERDGLALARHRHPRVKKSREEIADALTGNWRQEHLFALRQSMELYDVYHEKLAECDREIQAYLGTFESKSVPPSEETSPIRKSQRKPRKNEVTFDLRSELIRITGVDLTLIDGISTLTAQTIISECGFDMSRFPNEKRFASWLGLCPNRKITGGRVKSSRTRKVTNRISTALRVSAQSLHHSKSALGAFYRRKASRRSAPQAITATAHKLALIVYRMLKFGGDYVDKGQLHYEQRQRERDIKYLKKRAISLGYELMVTSTGEIVS